MKKMQMRVPQMAHVHSKELLLPLSSQANVSGMRRPFRAQRRSVRGWRKLTLGGFSVRCLRTTMEATAAKQNPIEPTRLMSPM